MGTDKFCLRWNDFENNISSAFRELRDDKDFFDVTLACDDEQIQAHKVILSACSPFFRNVLRRNPHQNPLLYLKGVKFTDLQSVLNFMYHGEVNVAQEELNSFLAVAEDLRVKGLTQNQSGGAPNTNNKKESSFNSSTQSSKPSNIPLQRDNTPAPKRPRPAPVQPNQSLMRQAVADDDIQEVIPVKSEPREVPAPIPISQPPVAMYTADPVEMTNALAPAEDDSMTYQESYGEYDQYEAEGDMQGYDGALVGLGDMGGEGNKGDVSGIEHLDALIAAKMMKVLDDGRSVWRCLECGKDYKLKGDASRHVEAYHVDHPGLSCNVCFKTLKNRESLRSHMTHLGV